jgi:dTDP-4-dehydrorhamnose reductase
VVNVQNTVALAKTLAAQGTFVVFPSTNLVYDGTVPFRKADDLVCPRTEYGRQKAEAETQLLSLGDSVAIVRFTKIIGPEMPLFRGWMRALRNGEAIHPFSDMVLAPVPLAFAVEVLRRVGSMRLPGILQVSGEKDITYEQVARYIAQRLGVDSDRVQPLSWRETGLHPEAVPKHTTLDTTRLRVECGMEPPDVWSAVEMVFFSIEPQSLTVNTGV